MEGHINGVLYTYNTHVNVIIPVQFSPEEITYTVGNNFSRISVPGSDFLSSHMTTSSGDSIDLTLKWTSLPGAPYRVLVFEGIDQSPGNAGKKIRKELTGDFGYGVRDVINALRVFTKPEYSIQDELNLMEDGAPVQFRDVPDCYFSFGTRTYVTKMEKLKIVERNFNPNTSEPQYAETDIGLTIQQNSDVYKLEQLQMLSEMALYRQKTVVA